jgi:hypothetical protein
MSAGTRRKKELIKGIKGKRVSIHCGKLRN